MQGTISTPTSVTPDPFIRRPRRLPWLAAIGLSLALTTPAYATDSAHGRKHVKLELKARKQRAAHAKSAGPLERLRSAGPALLRLEIVDRQGSSTKRLQLELLVNKERNARLETQVDRDQYELNVSPAATPGLLRIEVRRRGAESFQVSTLVDPQRPSLLSRVGSGTSHTEIRLIGVRSVSRARRPKP